MPDKYERSAIEQHFDEYGLKEWDRLVDTPRDLVSLHIHTHYLHEFIKPEFRVLEIGPGPGRFTIELAKIGTTICVGDISKRMLELNEQKVTEAGYADAIEWRKRIDVIDLSDISSDSFDATVVYGGPLSYVFENAKRALGEVLRVTKPNGYVFLGVMSSLGSHHLLIEAVLDLAYEHGLDVINRVVETGNVVGVVMGSSGHRCHMFRWSELKNLIEEHPCEILVASSCGFLSNSLHTEEQLREAMEKPDVWKSFLEWELEFCKEPGAIDSGTHMLVVLRKT